MNKKNLKPWPKGVSANPGGISKEKAALRRLFEEFVVEKGRFQKYLERLDSIAQNEEAKFAILAIREFLDKCLGKDFKIDIGEGMTEALAELKRVLTGDG